MNTRKDNKGKATKAWKAMGLAKIEKPLRFIRNRCAVTEIIKGETVTKYIYPYATAELMAKRGNGGVVQMMALKMARA